MSLLPPVGWADVATKHDLHQQLAMVEANLRTEMAGLRTEMSELEVRVHRDLQTMMFATIGAVIGTGSLAFGAATLV